MVKVKCFDVLFKSSRALGVARFDLDELFFLPDSGLVRNWRALRGDLVKGAFRDYLPSDLGSRLCSERLRSILEECATPADELQWLPVDIVAADGESRQYFILHFPSPPDIIDKAHSIMQGDFVVKPVLKADAPRHHSVFTYRGGGGSCLLVSENVKSRLQDAKLTGLQFDKVLIA